MLKEVKNPMQKFNTNQQRLFAQQMRQELINIYGELAFDNWLKFLIFKEIKQKEILFTVKNRFARDWIIKNYKDGILSTAGKILPNIGKLKIDLHNEFNQQISFNLNSDNISEKCLIKKNIDAKIKKVKKKNVQNVARADDDKTLVKKTHQIKNMILGNEDKVKKSSGKKNTRVIKKKNDKKELKNTKCDEVVLQISKMQTQNDFLINLNSRFTFDNFVVGNPNEFAFNSTKRVAEMVEIDPLTNPLFLRGDVGLGKTHLMHAAAFHMQSTVKRKNVAYMTAEKFMYQFIRALKEKSIMTFKEKLRSVDVLMIDDLQFMSGKEGTQEEFFHTFNSLIENKKQLIFAADRSPNELKGIEERIKSRLSGGLVVDIHTTNFELRFNILKAKARNLTIDFPTEVLKFLAENITTNVRELEGAFNKVIMHHEYTQKPITIFDTRELLRDMLRFESNIITIQDIQKKVIDYYNIRIDDLMGKSRLRKIAKPRQIAMFLSKELTAKSLLDIGKAFERDHTTVMYSIKTVAKNITQNDAIVEDMKKIKSLLYV